jgi:hypothetical protein
MIKVVVTLERTHKDEFYIYGNDREYYTAIKALGATF